MELAMHGCRVSAGYALTQPLQGGDCGLATHSNVDECGHRLAIVYGGDLKADWDVSNTVIVDGRARNDSVPCKIATLY